MREVLPALLTWWRQGEAAALATVVSTFRSAPRPPGASMVIGPDGSVVGSVSGGCVEGAVYDLGLAVLAGGPPAMQRFDVSDDIAGGVGLTCGGVLDVFVERCDRETFAELGALADALAVATPVALATVLTGPAAGRHLIIEKAGADPGHSATGGLDRHPGRGGLGTARWDDAVTDDARGMLAHGASGVLTYGPSGERRGTGLDVFVAAFAPPPRMIVFGAIDFAAAVATLGGFIGYRVTVCDARAVFATDRRFPDVAEVVVDWPHRYLAAEVARGAIDERTVLCVLTHDPKFDVPLLELALTLPVAYVGAMGSRRTHEQRLDGLRAAGLTPDQLAGLASPIGLDLGARTPRETAVSIAAEIIARQWQGGGLPLSTTTGAIHHSSADPFQSMSAGITSSANSSMPDVS